MQDVFMSLKPRNSGRFCACVGIAAFLANLLEPLNPLEPGILLTGTLFTAYVLPDDFTLLVYLVLLAHDGETPERVAELHRLRIQFKFISTYTWEIGCTLRQVIDNDKFPSRTPEDFLSSLQQDAEQ
jgi:hypothetical protein